MRRLKSSPKPHEPALVHPDLGKVARATEDPARKSGTLPKVPRGTLEVTEDGEILPAGSKLADAMAIAQQTEKEDEKTSIATRARAIVFESANAPRKVIMGAAFEAIVGKVFLTEREIDESYAMLEKDLTLAENVFDYTHATRALDKAETNWRLSHRLYLSAKQIFEDWERDTEVTFSTLRAEATRALQQEKEKGHRSKQITDADVESMCAQLFPEQWRESESRRRRYKLTVDSLLNFVEVWSSKCRSLQTIVGKLR